MKGHYETLIESDRLDKALKAIAKLDEIRNRLLLAESSTPLFLQRIHDAWAKELLWIIKTFGDRGDTFDRIAALARLQPESLAMEDILKIYTDNKDSICRMHYKFVGGGYGVGAVMAYMPMEGGIGNG